jgi:hypothetical protein
MSETNDGTPQENQWCSRTTLKDLTAKEKRFLIVSSDKANSENVERIVKANVPKDLSIHSIRKEHLCEVEKHLNLKGMNGAVLVENGEVKAKIDLSGDDSSKTTALTKLADVDKREEQTACRPTYYMDGNRWILRMPSDPACKREIQNLGKLPKASADYLRNHIEQEQ